MIRKFEPWDIDAVMEIWLDANCSAHDFIHRDYFESALDMVRSQIPQSEAYVCEEDGQVRGFIGLDGSFVQGLFVRPDCQGRGIGKALVDHVKQEREVLSLQVYRKNERAFGFYRREDFNVAEVDVDSATGEAEITMQWCRA